MKKFLMATAAVAVLTASVPASAQVGDILRQGLESVLGRGSSSNTYASDPRLAELNTRVQASYQRGDMSQSEATRLQAELRAIAERENAYRSGGLSQDERIDLQRRIQAVEGRMEQASYNDGRNDRNDRYDQDDRNDRNDRNDRDDRNDRNDRNDRYDRDDRWSDNDRNGRGCPPGLARKNNGCMAPGQAMRQGERYTNQYAAVPASYGQRYRDTQRFLYRYNDGRIYQVDRRTNRIVKVTAVRR